MGRPARTQSVATRFTKAEEAELLKAAEKEGKTLREWTRDALLREARQPADDPVFTELIAMRIFLNNALRMLLAGKNLPDERFEELMEGVRQEKRNTARKTMKQYAPPDPA
jgi:phytoene/squalene synthetase